MPDTLPSTLPEKGDATGGNTLGSSAAQRREAAVKWVQEP